MPLFRTFFDENEFLNQAHRGELGILMISKKKFTLLAAQEAEKSTKLTNGHLFVITCAYPSVLIGSNVVTNI